MKFMKETDFSLKQSPNSYQKQESTDNINCRKKHYLCHNDLSSDNTVYYFYQLLFDFCEDILRGYACRLGL